MVTRVFDPVQYCALVLRRFQTVEIDIRDATGVKIPFERGRMVVTLHCRKRKESYLEWSKDTIQTLERIMSTTWIRQEGDIPCKLEHVFIEDMD